MPTVDTREVIPSDAAGHFALLRPLLQLPGTSDKWRALMRPLNHALANREFREDYTQYVHSALDAWPDEVRVIEKFDPVNLRPFGRVLSLLGAKQRGQGYHNVYTSKNEVLKEISEFDGCDFEGYVGLRIIELSRFPLFVLQSYLELLPKPLRRIYLLIDPNTYSSNEKYRVSPEQVGEVLSWLFMHHPDLEHVGLNYIHYGVLDEHLDVMWSSLIEWAPKLTSLRGLSIGIAKTNQLDQKKDKKYIDWGEEILNDPHFDALHTIEECHLFYRIPRDVLKAREASANLRRLRLFGVNRQEGLELIQSPHLAGVEVWEATKEAETLEFGWGTEQAQAWANERAVLRGEVEEKPHFLLTQPKADLTHLDSQELAAVLFNQKGELMASDMVEEFEFWAGLTPKELLCLFRDGAKLYPNLRRFSIKRVSLDDKQVKKLGKTALMSQLDSLELCPTFLSFQGYFAMDKFSAQCERWVTLINQESLNMHLRRYAWQCFIDPEFSTAKHMKARAKALGLKGVSKLNAAALVKAVEQANPVP